MAALSACLCRQCAGGQRQWALHTLRMGLVTILPVVSAIRPSVEPLLHRHGSRGCARPWASQTSMQRQVQQVVGGRSTSMLRMPCCRQAQGLPPWLHAAHMHAPDALFCRTRLRLLSPHCSPPSWRSALSHDRSTTLLSSCSACARQPSFWRAAARASPPTRCAAEGAGLAGWRLQVQRLLEV